MKTGTFVGRESNNRCECGHTLLNRKGRRVPALPRVDSKGRRRFLEAVISLEDAIPGVDRAARQARPQTAVLRDVCHRSDTTVPHPALEPNPLRNAGESKTLKAKVSDIAVDNIS